MSRRITAAATAAVAVVAIILATGGASGANGQRPPRNVTPPSISGTPRVPNSLSASTGTWQGKNLRFAYQWLRCDSSGAACSAIGGAIGSTYTLIATDGGHTLRVIVTATNRWGSAASTSAQTAVVQGASVPPSNTALPTISGTAQLGQTLTSTTGTWSGSTPMTYTRQWQRCDTSGAACAPISGAIASTYVLVSADVGHTLRVSITASNTVGSATASSAHTAVVAGTSSPPPPPPPPASYIRGLGLIRYANLMCSTSNLSQYGWLDSASQDSSWGCAASQSTGLALGYFNPVSICTVLDDGVLYSVANGHEDWFLHTAAGARISISSAAGTCYLADPGNLGYQNEFKTHVAARIAGVAGADGVFLDNIIINWNNLTLSGTPSRYPIDASGHAPGWEAAIKSFLANAATYLRAQGRYVEGSAAAWCSCGGAQNSGALSQWWWHYLTDASGHSLLSGIFVEHWMKPSSSYGPRLVGTDAWYKQWDSYEGLQAYAHSLGADFTGEDADYSVGSTPATRVARFSRATYLLDYDCGRGAWAWHTSASDPWATIDHNDPGCPLGAKTQVATNVWRRDFTNGYVIVNPTAAAVTVGGVSIASGDAVIHQN